MQHLKQGRIGLLAVLGLGVMLSGVAAAQGKSTIGPIRWMAPEALSKSDLSDAMASRAGLSKADAKKALDGFIDASTKIMSGHIENPLYCWGSSSTRSIIDPLDPDDDNDGLPDLTWAAFGAFSVVSGGVGASGCPAPNEVVFHAGPAFHAHENPLSQGTEWHGSSSSARAIPPSIAGVEVTAPAIPYGGGQIVAFGSLGERASFHTGDDVCVFDDTGIVARATVVGVAVEARRGRFDVVDSTASGGAFLGLVLEGPPHREIRRGMRIAACPSERPVRCEDPVRGADDDDIIAGIVRETRLPVRTAAAALAAMYDVISTVVNNGGIVDLEGFGRFEAETVITATITETRRPPILVIDVWERSISLVGASQGEIDAAERLLEAQAKRSARTGRNPQTGKEIKIAAKNVVKFKAGADLSGKVN